MKKWLFSALIVALAAAFAVVLLPGRQVQAACGTILTGSFASAAPNQTSPTFSVLAGDVVIATSVDSNGTATSMGAEITINGTVYAAGITGTGTVTTSATAPANGTGSVFFYNSSGTGGTISWTITIGGPNCGGSAPLAFTDGRVNPQAWATAVLYCADHAVQVYDVDNASIGRLLFVVTPEEIAEVGVPSSNTVIDSATGVRGLVAVYRLASGEFQVVAPDTEPGKYYSFTWPGC
ncbi:MAG: hypothetical protein U0694_11110 [Anaerolineae bacterium]